MGFIYILENRQNGKCYVGQTTQTVQKRINAHISRSDSAIGLAIDKYGIEGFNIYSFECYNEDLDYFEKGFIKQMNTIAKNGYNLDSGGCIHKHLTQESKDKISKANKGRKVSDELKEKLRKRMIGKNNPFYGKHHSNKTKNKMIGRKNSKQSKKKMSDIQKERMSDPKNNPMYGKKHSKETRKKISKKLKGLFTGEKNPMFGKHHSEKTKEKLRQANIGKPPPFNGKKHTEEALKKMRVKKSEEHKRKMSENHADFKGHKHPKSKKIICLNTGEIFKCIKYAAEKYNLSRASISCYLRTNVKNKDGLEFKYYEEK